MKISKNRLREIILEEVNIFKNLKESENILKTIEQMNGIKLTPEEIENIESALEKDKQNKNESFENDVEIKSTGEFSDMTISELKKEVAKLKKENDKFQEENKKVPEKNIKRMGQLLFAIRAKQGWKKGEGSTGL
jgi:hypothetical protein